MGLHKRNIFIFVLALIGIGLAGCTMGFGEKTEGTYDDLLQQVFTVSPEQRELAEYSTDALIGSLVIENATYSILSSDETKIELEVTAPDMRTLFSYLLDFDADMTDPHAEYDRIAANIIASLERGAPTVTNIVVVGIEQIDGQPSLIMCDEFLDAMYGGMISFFHELMEMGNQ